MSKESKPAGGIKGFLQRTGKLGLWVRDTGSSAVKWTYRVGGKTAFMLATTSMVVLMPLLFEITREAQLVEMERLEVNDLKTKGYSDRQLKDLGFTDMVLHVPSVASMSSLAKS